MTISDSLMDQTFVICQYYLKECSEMMEEKSLDIVIMCAIYGVCRAKNVDIKFKTMISVYKRVNNMDDRAFEAIQEFEDSDKEDFSIVVAIIKFYNTEFMPLCKKMLLKIKG
jgi:retinoblastoma-associated protein